MGRIHYPECEVEVAAFGDTEAFACDDAEVWIDGDMILVSYFDDDGIVVLEGTREGEDGWQFRARSRPRRAFLAPMAETPDMLIGEIDEQGETAVWRVLLREPATLV